MGPNGISESSYDTANQQKFAKMDAEFAKDDLPIDSLEMGKKISNICEDLRILFGADLRTPCQGPFNAELSHIIHRIIGRDSIPGAGELWKMELHGPQTSVGRRSTDLAPTEDAAAKKLDELFSHCNGLIADSESSLTLNDKFRSAAYFLHRYLAIHPYKDGNGRTARLLTSLLLMRLGAASMPVCFNLRPGNRELYIEGLSTEVTGPESETLQLLARMLQNAAAETEKEFLPVQH